MQEFMLKLKNKKSKFPVIIFFAVLMCLMLLNAGFAAFSNNLDISAKAWFRIQKDIRVTGIYVSNTSNEASSNYEEYNANNITSSVNLPNANSTITYHIEVTNLGNVEQGIFAINETYKNSVTNTYTNLEIKNKTVNLKETLCDDANSNKCKLGSISTFDITIGYKNNGYNGTDLAHLIRLDFDFRQIFNITYEDFTGSTSGLVSKMMDGDSIIITFDSTCGIPTSVTVDGATGSYTSPNLVLSNVEDDITISATYAPVDQFVYLINVNQYVYHGMPIPSMLSVYNSPQEAMAAFDNRPIYFKHILVDGNVMESYLNFVITPEQAQNDSDLNAGTYSLRGGIDESELTNKPIFNSNINILKQAFGEDSWFCSYNDSNIVGCNSSSIGLYVEVFTNGTTGIYLFDDLYCGVDNDGDSNCGNY